MGEAVLGDGAVAGVGLGCVLGAADDRLTGNEVDLGTPIKKENIKQGTHDLLHYSPPTLNIFTTDGKKKGTHHIYKGAPFLFMRASAFCDIRKCCRITIKVKKKRHSLPFPVINL